MLSEGAKHSDRFNFMDNHSGLRLPVKTLFILKLRKRALVFSAMGGVFFLINLTHPPPLFRPTPSLLITSHVAFSGIVSE